MNPCYACNGSSLKPGLNLMCAKCYQKLILDNRDHHQIKIQAQWIEDEELFALDFINESGERFIIHLPIDAAEDLAAHLFKVIKSRNLKKAQDYMGDRNENTNDL